MGYLIFSLLLMIGSFLLCLSYECGTFISIPLGISLLSLVSIFGFLFVKLPNNAILAKTMILLYSLPFVHVFDYFFYESILGSDFIWGLVANPYQIDLEVIKRMTIAGAVGCLAFVSGLLFSVPFKVDSNSFSSSRRSLQVWPFLFIAAFSLFLSYINAPVDTIFTAAYTTSSNRLGSFNFNGAWLLSYVGLILLFIDSLIESRMSIKKFKLSVVFFIFLTVVVWFQFLRGDRECVGLVVAFFAMYISYRRLKFKSRKALILIGLVVLFFITGQVVGVVRSAASHGDFSASSKVDFTSGTWSAVLLTPLSVVGDFYHGYMKPKLGQTYLDFLLSIPPGFITQALGIDRPIESSRGPAWEMTYGLGGTHAMVVPFMNFRTIGIFFVLFTYGIIVGGVENISSEFFRVERMLLYGTFFVVAPFWFWYGEMYLIRGLMAYCFFWFLYKLSPKVVCRKICFF